MSSRLPFLFLAFALSSLAIVACSGGGSTPSGGGGTAPTATPKAGSTPTPKATTTATPAPSATPTAGTSGAVTFNDWTQYGYDAEHDGYNPNSAAFTPANLTKLHDAGIVSLGDFGTQTQPIVATNVAGHAAVLYVGGGSGTEYAVDALTGKQVWAHTFGTESFECGGSTSTFGIGGSAAYDATNAALYFPDGTNAEIDLYDVSPATGAMTAKANITPTTLPGERDFAHTSVTLANGRAYIGTSSTCDIPSWRGRVADVSVPAMTLASTFFTTYGRGGNYGGGGVWGWGGAALDPSGNVYVGVGNADVGNPPSSSFTAASSEQAGYGEHLVQVSNDLSTVEASNYPGYTFGGDAVDLDLVGSPVVFQPAGCPELTAVQGKSGGVYFYDTGSIANGPIATFQFGEGSDQAGFAGNLGFSPVTQQAYVDVAASTGEGSLEPPGLVAIAFPGCAPTIAANVAFGIDGYSLGYVQPRSAPTLTAGGLIFVSSPNASSGGDVFALDATSLAVLNGGKPIFSMPAVVRMAPVVDGQWLFVMDQNGDLARWTIDPNYVATAAQVRRAQEHRPVRPLLWKAPAHQTD